MHKITFDSFDETPLRKTGINKGKIDPLSLLIWLLHVGKLVTNNSDVSALRVDVKVHVRTKEVCTYDITAVWATQYVFAIDR